MTQETNPQTKTLVPFTVCLPHEIAGKIIALARDEHLLPEAWLQNTILTLLQTLEMPENDPRNATLSSPDTGDVAAQELRKKFIALNDRRTRTAEENLSRISEEYRDAANSQKEIEKRVAAVEKELAELEQKIARLREAEEK